MLKRSGTYLLIFMVVFILSSNSHTSDSLKIKRWIITTSVFEYWPTFKLNTGNFNAGTEIYLKRNNSLAVNAGIINSYGKSNGLLSIEALSTKGIKLQVEGRHYFGRLKIWEPAILLFWPHILQYKSQILENTGYYMAVHSSFQQTATKRPDDLFSHTGSDQNIYTVNRNVYTLNIKFGYQCIKKCGLTIDYSVGLGGQYISSSAKNRAGNDSAWPNSQEDFPNKLFDHGSKIYPNIVYQVKFGWAW
jgi:hypothetical protein